MTKAKYCAVAALILAGCFTAAAQTATASGQEPPLVADKGTTIQANCIDENDHHVMRRKQPMFMIEFTNKCEQRFTCKVFAYITSARGASHGRGTIVLAPQSHGAAASGSYAFKTKSNGGNSISDRECRVF